MVIRPPRFLGLLLLLLPPSLFAEVVPIDVDLNVTSNCSQGYCQRSVVRGFGSGIVIGRTVDDKFAVVLTAGHVIKGDVKKIWVDGVEITHLVYKYDSEDDIAVLLVKGRWTATPLTDLLSPGDSLTLCGYSQSSTDLESRSGTTLNTSTATASMPAEEGLSGGPLLNKQGQVAGICSGYWTTKTRKRQTIFTPGNRIHTFMRSKSIQVQGQSAPPPPTEKLPPLPKDSPRHNKPSTGNDSPTPQQDVSALESRLASIEAKISKISAGPPGPAGPEGIPGPRGNPGPAGPAGIITVILKDQSGNVIDTHSDIASGSTVTVPVTKKLKAPSPPTS